MFLKIWLLLLTAHKVSSEVLYREALVDNHGKVTIQDVPFEHSLAARIVGGVEVDPNSFPHVVSLTFSGSVLQWFCGGALIDASWVITTAHCIREALSVEILLGAHNRLDSSETSQVTITATSFTSHPNFADITLQNNIGLIQLDSPVTLTPEIQPIALTSTDPADGTLLTMTGWGSTVDGVEVPTDTLHEVDVPSISNTECAQTYTGPTIYDGLICTNGNGVGACDGDGGGPLNWGEDARITLVGLISFMHADGCSTPYPQGSTRITYFLDWIEQVSGVTP